MTEETREVDVVQAVALESSIDAEITVQDGPATLVIVAAAGDHESVLTEVREGTLHVNSANGVFNGKRLVRLTVPELSELSLDSSGDAEVRGASGPLVVSVQGSGDVALTGLVSAVDAKLTSAGDLEIDGLDGPVRIVVRGSGDALLDGRITGLVAELTSAGGLGVSGIDAETVDVWVGGSGDAELEGQAAQLVATTTSVGDIDASDLQIGSAQVSVRGSGDIAVHASETITGNLASLGDLHVSGTAAVDVELDGLGQVRR